MNNLNTMNNKNDTPERYFLLTNGEIEECTKGEFDAEDGDTYTERHTVFTNGVNQICHTKTLEH